MNRYLLALLTVSACASPPPRIETVEQLRSASYKLAPTDLVSVTVYPDGALSRKARVDADGTISLPLIGAAKIAGSTILEAQRELERRLSAYLVKPHVTLFVEEYGNRQMFLLGEVRNPGSYPIPPGSRMTLLQAISAAGGFTKVAALGRTQILRQVDGKRVHQVVDLKAVTKGEESGKDILVEPNDVVFIPQSLF